MFIIKRLVSACALGVFAFTLYSYSLNFPVYVSEITEVEQTEEVAQENMIVEVDSEPKIIEFTYSKMFKSRLEDNLSNCQRLHIVQEMSSSDKSETYLNKSSYEIDSNFFNKNMYFTVSSINDLQESSVKYYIDNSSAIYLTSADGSTWTKAVESIRQPDFNIDEFTNASEFYRYIIRGFEVPDNTVGELDKEGNIYFEYIEPAKSIDLQGVSYDTLGDKTIKMMFKRSSDYYEPVVTQVSVTFTIKGIEYVSSAVLRFIDIDNSELPLPNFDFSTY